VSRYVVHAPEVLAEYREAADQPEFWTQRWKGTDLARYFERYEGGYLAYFDGLFRKHLPRDAPVLEAGCGRGQYVLALQRRGYDVYGIEFSEETVAAAREAEPTLNVRVGDLRALDFEDGFFGAYISLGVIEHYYGGPDEIMREAHRVVRPGGKLLLSVPHFSPCFRRRMEDDSEGPGGSKDFYQFYFSRDEIEERIRDFGFEPEESFFYDCVYGAKRSFPKVMGALTSNRIFRAALTRINRLPGPQSLFRHFSHMIMIVATRT